ncbi:hypothetical protein BDB01DRAFT_780729 [Pilobolus umbonatus]|nr:hypothetical protein BDB01DRAFT_780729 [Pilobolus umbonatus]
MAAMDAILSVIAYESYSDAYIIFHSNCIYTVYFGYGMLVIIMIICGVISATLYTFQSRFTFTGPKPMLCSTSMICACSIILRRVYQIDPVQILGPITVAILFCLYLILELYYAMGVMTPDDPILANITFHINIAYPINYIHHLCELSDPIDSFPELFDPRLA